MTSGQVDIIVMQQHGRWWWAIPLDEETIMGAESFDTRRAAFDAGVEQARGIIGDT